VCRRQPHGHVEPERDQADPGPDRPPGSSAFTRISLEVPTLAVDTADGYRPGLDQIVAFVNGPA